MAENEPLSFAQGKFQKEFDELMKNGDNEGALTRLRDFMQLPEVTDSRKRHTWAQLQEMGLVSKDEDYETATEGHFGSIDG